MTLHYLALLLGEAALLEENIVPYAYLSNVVQGAGEAYAVNDLLRAFHGLRYLDRVPRHPVRVVLRIGVPRVKRVKERIERAYYARKNVLGQGDVLELQRGLGRKVQYERQRVAGDLAAAGPAGKPEDDDRVPVYYHGREKHRHRAAFRHQAAQGAAGGHVVGVALLRQNAPEGLVRQGKLGPGHVPGIIPGSSPDYKSSVIVLDDHDERHVGVGDYLRYVHGLAEDVVFFRHLVKGLAYRMEYGKLLYLVLEAPSRQLRERADGAAPVH